MKLSYNETVCEAGGQEKTILFVMLGTLMLLDGAKVVKVVQPGQFISIHEYLLNIRTQWTGKARSKHGTWVVHIPKPLLDAQFKSHPELAASFFRCMAKQAAREMFVMLITEQPTAVFACAHDLHVPLHLALHPHAHDLRHREEEEEEEDSKYARDVNIVKLLKLRKSDFLKHIDEKGINLLAGGMGCIKLARGSLLMKQVSASFSLALSLSLARTLALFLAFALSLSLALTLPLSLYFPPPPPPPSLPPSLALAPSRLPTLRTSTPKRGSIFPRAFKPFPSVKKVAGL